MPNRRKAAVLLSCGEVIMPYHHLLTEEGEHLLGQLKENPAYCPWNVYPRPQLRRDSFFCLNGSWIFRSSPEQKETETILVPFPPESRLSGICRHMGEKPELYYKKLFRLPDGFVKDRVLLHFGAVDQTAKVILNGRELGKHSGGYDPFSFEITEYLESENVLEVYVTDDLKSKLLPYGKQREKRGGMWYTPISGIWQTVWIESVSKDYIKNLHIQTTANTIKITAEGVQDGEVTVYTPSGTICALMQNGTAEIVIPDPRMWSPEDPYLYSFTVRTETDSADSYFALRTLDIREVNGIPRICLNGKPYFFNGLLDQGYYADGIFTPAAPSSYTKDIETAKSMGFNMLRKHIKSEPECFYYDCDRLGMIVFQDMINNGNYSFLRDTALPTVGLKRMPDILMHRNHAQRKAFAETMENTVRRLYNHPCICCWTIFNEGWGQFCGSNMYRELRKLDDSRIIDTASGWFSGVESDVESIHVYFKPVRIRPADKPAILSEFGGYSCKIEDHSYNTEKTYGYRFYDNTVSLEDALLRLYEEEIIPAVKTGMCGAVYTQLSDVEDETNGLLTYDRRILKVNREKMQKMSEKLYEEMHSTSEIP